VTAAATADTDQQVSPSRHLLVWALAGFLAGTWAAASVEVVFAAAFVCAGLGALLACFVRPRALVFASWLVFGFGLAAANHAMVESAAVAHPGRFDAVGIVGSDLDAGAQVLRVRGGRVRLVGLHEALPLGATMHVRGGMRPLQGDDAMRRRSHYGRLDAEVHVASTTTERGPPPLLAMANAARSRLQEAVAAGLGGDRAGLLLGLLIGDDASLSDSVVEDFRRGGLSHLLVVSGSNLGFVMGAVAFVTMRLPLGRRTRIAVAAAVLVLYVLVTRAEPSVLRATAMTATALALAWVGAPGDRVGACAAAVLALVVCDPFLAASVGFQLSAAATVGILVLAPALAERLRTRLPQRLSTALALTTAAQIGVTPLLVWHFQRASAVGVLTNLVAVPLAGVVTVAGAVLAAPAVAWQSAFAPLGPLLGALLRVGHLSAGLPGADLAMPRWTLLAAGLASAAAVVAVRISSRRRTARSPATSGWCGLKRWHKLAVAVLVLTAATAVPVVNRLTTAALCDGVTFLDVGQGDATLLHAQDGTTVLVDTGPSQSRLDDQLRRYGVDSVDLLVLTHGDADHVGGVGAVAGRRRVSTVVEPVGITWPSEKSRSARDRLAANGVSARAVTAGEDVSVGDVRLHVLHPFPGTVATKANDVAIVAVAEVAGLRVLLTADADAEVQRRVLHHVGDVDVAKVPHHGSRDQEPDLPREARAEVSVVPVGPNNYGHPTTEALRMWGGPGSREYRNDVDGTVEVCASGRPHETEVHLR